MRTINPQVHLRPLVQCLAFVSLIIVCGPYATHAQKEPVKKKPDVLLANLDANSMPLKTILANPVLVATKPGCKVTSFTVSFLPKGGEYFGPFKTEGNTIKENQVNYLKEFTTMNVRIFVEEIHVNCGGRDSVVAPVIVLSVP